MANLPTQSFATIVQSIVAGIQGRVAALIDFSLGEPLLAIAEAIAGVGLWLQTQFLQVLGVSRLTTSFGPDVDSFVGQFSGFPPRLLPSFASGALTYSRFTATPATPFIPVGSTVQTADGTQSVQVIADTTNAAYSAILGGFTVPANQASLTVAAQALSVGPLGNIQAGQLIVPTTPITGIDTVTNALAFSNGLPAETDTALKARFALWILGLARANLYGIESALANLNVNIQYTVTDQFTYGGAFAPGYFYVVVDDGSGSPSSTFLTTAQNAINVARGLGINFSVFAPNIVLANVNMITTAAPGYDGAIVASTVSTLITNNITALGLGAGLPYSILGSWAFSVAGVVNANAITLQGGTADIAANNQNRILPGAITVSPS